MRPEEGGAGLEGNRYVQIVSYLELLRLQGHGVISPLSPRHGAANLLYSIARPFKIRKNNCKIEVCAFFWLLGRLLLLSWSILSKGYHPKYRSAARWRGQAN